ncbi:hypothetical protein CDL12_01900 [Handroanthus impetiginosus]|uniref:Uncharacterized protein n=1 Tax=Handroanthus impetiginosus TaxID=429701 RepID=A0A2G9I6G7_9LAMI|nr:hypothetical protein CDL12_01900 [Handroanthus impetiginosus]
MKHAIEIYMHLNELYSVQTLFEHYNTSKELFRARMVEESSVHEYGLKIISLMEKLRKLDVVMDNDISFDQFAMNFNMSKLDVTVNELVNILVTSESPMKKDKTTMIAATSKVHKGKRGKKKKKSSFSKEKQVPKL